jgi:hypothetical protein
MAGRGLSSAGPFQQSSGDDWYTIGMGLNARINQLESAANADEANTAAGAKAAAGDMGGAAQEYYRRGHQDQGLTYANQDRQQQADARARQEQELRRQADLTAGAKAAAGDMSGAAQEYYRRGLQAPGAAYGTAGRQQQADAREQQEQELRRQADLAAGAKAAAGDMSGAAQEYYRRGLQSPGTAYGTAGRQADADAIEWAKRRDVRAANNQSVENPEGAASAMLRTQGPEAAAPYQALAEKQLKTAAETADHVHEALARTKTPEDWNQVVDVIEQNMPADKRPQMESLRINDPNAFDALKARHLVELNTQRDILRGRIGQPLPVAPGATAGGKAAPVGIKMPEDIAAGYEAAYGEKLPMQWANLAYKQGSLVERGPNGKPVLVAPEHSKQALTEHSQNLRAVAQDPMTVYASALSRGVAKNEALNYARSAQAEIVSRHLNDAASLAGGWELDDTKLSNAQYEQRERFNDSTGFLRGRNAYGIIRGEIEPTSDIPLTMMEVRSINTMLQSEIGRLATTGQGAVAESTRKHLDTVVGDLVKSPSPETYLQFLGFAKQVMDNFKDVPTQGVERLGVLSHVIRQRQHDIDSIAVPSAGPGGAPAGPGGAPAGPGGAPAGPGGAPAGPGGAPAGPGGAPAGPGGARVLRYDRTTGNMVDTADQVAPGKSDAMSPSPPLPSTPLSLRY